MQVALALFIRAVT